jgi:hypothetical protein
MLQNTSLSWADGRIRCYASFRQGLDLAAASMDGKRYLLASPRERALFSVVYARALGAAGQKSAAAEALIKAEDDLASATTGDDAALSAFGRRGIPATVELDARACAYLSSAP